MDLSICGKFQNVGCVVCTATSEIENRGSSENFQCLLDISAMRKMHTKW